MRSIKKAAIVAGLSAGVIAGAGLVPALANVTPAFAGGGSDSPSNVAPAAGTDHQGGDQKPGNTAQPTGTQTPSGKQQTTPSGTQNPSGKQQAAPKEIKIPDGVKCYTSQYKELTKLNEGTISQVGQIEVTKYDTTNSEAIFKFIDQCKVVNTQQNTYHIPSLSYLAPIDTSDNLNSFKDFLAQLSSLPKGLTYASLQIDAPVNKDQWSGFVDCVNKNIPQVEYLHLSPQVPDGVDLSSSDNKIDFTKLSCSSLYVLSALINDSIEKTTNITELGLTINTQEVKATLPESIKDLHLYASSIDASKVNLSGLVAGSKLRSLDVPRELAKSALSAVNTTKNKNLKEVEIKAPFKITASDKIKWSDDALKALSTDLDSVKDSLPNDVTLRGYGLVKADNPIFKKLADKNRSLLLQDTLIEGAADASQLTGYKDVREAADYITAENNGPWFATLSALAQANLGKTPTSEHPDVPNVASRNQAHAYTVTLNIPGKVGTGIHVTLSFKTKEERDAAKKALFDSVAETKKALKEADTKVAAVEKDEATKKYSLDSQLKVADSLAKYNLYKGVSTLTGEQLKEVVDAVEKDAKAAKEAHKDDATAVKATKAWAEQVKKEDKAYTELAKAADQKDIKQFDEALKALDAKPAEGSQTIDTQKAFKGIKAAYNAIQATYANAHKADLKKAIAEKKAALQKELDSFKGADIAKCLELKGMIGACEALEKKFEKAPGQSDEPKLEAGDLALIQGVSADADAVVKAAQEYAKTQTQSNPNTPSPSPLPAPNPGTTTPGSTGGTSGGSPGTTGKATKSTFDTVATRLAGETMYDTMQKIVQKAFPNTCKQVVLATGESYYDALSANSLAGSLNAPVLLTTKAGLPEQTINELKRLKPEQVFICGGTNAISNKVADQLKDMKIKTERLAGQWADDTANDIAKKLDNSDTAVVATSWGFEDALSAASFAYSKKAPIFLASYQNATLSAETIQTMKAKGVKKVYIVGGAAVVSSAVEGQLKAEGIAFERVAGETAYDTSAKLATKLISLGMSVNNLGVATGWGYADALSGAALCGQNNSIMLLADDGNQTTVKGVVKDNKEKISNMFIFGGDKVVGGKAVDALKEVFNG